MLKILKSKRGVTLVELVVSMIILSIMFTAVAAVLVPSLGTYNKANELAEINTLLDNVANELMNDLSRARSVTMKDGGIVEIITATENIQYYIQEVGADDKKQKLLYRGGGAVLEASYYKKKSVNVEYFTASGDNKGTEITRGAFPGEFFVTITISDSDGVMASRDYAVKPIGMMSYN